MSPQTTNIAAEILFLSYVSLFAHTFSCGRKFYSYLKKKEFCETFIFDLRFSRDKITILENNVLAIMFPRLWSSLRLVFSAGQLTLAIWVSKI